MTREQILAILTSATATEQERADARTAAQALDANELSTLLTDLDTHNATAYGDDVDPATIDVDRLEADRDIVTELRTHHTETVAAETAAEAERVARIEAGRAALRSVPDAPADVEVDTTPLAEDPEDAAAQAQAEQEAALAAAAGRPQAVVNESRQIAAYLATFLNRAAGEATQGIVAGGAQGGRASLEEIRRHTDQPAGPRPEMPAAPFTAAANIDGFAPGAAMSWDDVVSAFGSRFDAIRGAEGSGARERVARFNVAFPEELTLRKGELVQNTYKRLEALVAASTIVNPVAPYYPLEVLSGASRPVRDKAFTNFGAERGGINFVTPPHLGDLDGAVSYWSALNDGAPGAANEDMPFGTGNGPSTKAIVDVALGSRVEKDVYAVPLRLRFKNIPSRTFPEHVAANTQLSLATHARYAENLLLRQTDSYLRRYKNTGTLGTLVDTLSTTDLALAGMNKRNRMDGVAFKMILPASIRDEIRVDFMRQCIADAATDPQKIYALADAVIESFFTARNITPVWHLDGEADQQFVPESASTTFNNSGTVNAGSTSATLTAPVPPGYYTLTGGTPEVVQIKSMAGNVATFGAATVNAHNDATGVVSVSTHAPLGTGNAIASPALLEPWPAVKRVRLYPADSFTYLDGGRLDLGLVRDSSLNAVNKYETYVETFEGLAFTGIDGVSLDLTTYPMGLRAATRDTSGLPTIASV